MNQPRIPFYRPALPPLEEYVQLLKKIWESRMLSNFSSFSQQLEAKASEYLNCTFVKSVVSADIGLILTLKALNLPAEAPCYVSDFTFNSTMNAPLWANLRPVLVDVDRETFNLSPEALSPVIKKFGGPGVVLATHVFGNPCDVESLEFLARQHDCFLIFDAAHALGSRKRARPVGCFGDAEVFSLSGTKIVTSGEGGLIATTHQWLADKLTYLRAYGFQHDYFSRYVGMNGKISELHSALGLLSLSRIEELLALRQNIVAYYRNSFGEKVQWQRVHSDDRSTYKDVSIGIGKRAQIMEKFLADRGVQTKRYFVPLHLMEPYREFSQGSYLVSEDIYNSTLCIPAYPDLASEDLDYVSSQVLEAIGQS